MFDIRLFDLYIAKLNQRPSTAKKSVAAVRLIKTPYLVTNETHS